MVNSGTERVWLVERSYGRSEDLVTLVYASRDGERQVTRQLSRTVLSRTEMTAARDVPLERLETVPEEERERYRDEAVRMADSHDPDETV